MYLISIDSLEKLRKALVNSNKNLENANTEDKKRKAIEQNKKAIKVVDFYLNPEKD